ncbi:transcription factor gata-4 [Anaeramoeba flamelloides]|uniref:Transcription factor gata-4 n=1 Tax=Anaeramoeba flamelloides TaxID=1746091 RepID=A0AAV7YHT7_9EUKA|nr:transcription factor gata-4 [Anaeramoeba flamelloides]
MSKTKICSNPDCKARTTPIWRRIDGDFYCNACGMYKKRHNGKNRPISESQNSGKKKKRICKIVTINRPYTYSDHSSPIYSDGMNSQNNEEGLHSSENGTRKKTRTVFRFKNSPRHENKGISNSPNDQQSNPKGLLFSPRSPRSPISPRSPKNSITSNSPIHYGSLEMNKSKQSGLFTQYKTQNQSLFVNQTQPNERSYLNSSNLFSRFSSNNFPNQEKIQSTNGLETENENENENEINNNTSNNSSSVSMSETDGEEWIEEEKDENISDENHYSNENESENDYQDNSQNNNYKSEIPLKNEMGNNQNIFFSAFKTNNLRPQQYSNFDKSYQKQQQQQQQNSIFNKRNFNLRNNINNNSQNILFKDLSQSSSQDVSSTSLSFLKSKQPKENFHNPNNFIHNHTGNGNGNLNQKRNNSLNFQNQTNGCEVENKTTNLRKGDCVAIRVPRQPEIYAVILDFKKSSKTQKVFVQVRWLLPKVHPFHQNHFNFNIGQLKRNDFDLGDFEKILQPVGSIKRKLNFRFVD